MNLIERLELWDKLINMKDQYNIMYLKNILMSFLDFDNAYKVFMLSSFSGSKLMTGVLGYPLTPWLTVSDHKGTVKEKLINVN
jgi:hypothetical protein